VILIAGDSWGCGECGDWRTVNTHQYTSHTGLTQYLHEYGHTVINISNRGESNSNTVKSLINFFDINSHLPITAILVFQTDWTRDLGPLFPVFPEHLQDHVAHGYPGMWQQLLTQFYSRLSDLATRIDKPIYVIGGCADTDYFDEFEKEFPGVVIACQSMTNLILTGNHQIADPVHEVFTRVRKAINEFMQLCKKQLSDSELDLLLSDVDLAWSRRDLWAANPEFFWPDGVHANRHGHRVLFDFLIDTVPELKNTK
jgi:hypothetical protein